MEIEKKKKHTCRKLFKPIYENGLFEKKNPYGTTVTFFVHKQSAVQSVKSVLPKIMTICSVHKTSVAVGWIPPLGEDISELNDCFWSQCERGGVAEQTDPGGQVKSTGEEKQTVVVYRLTGEQRSCLLFFFFRSVKNTCPFNFRRAVLPNAFDPTTVVNSRVMHITERSVRNVWISRVSPRVDRLSTTMWYYDYRFGRNTIDCAGRRIIRNDFSVFMFRFFFQI